MDSIAIIPARGGSKRLPHKNIKTFINKPIIAYSIESAINSELFDEVMVSTDDDMVASVALKYGAKVPFIRSAENSGDYATLFDVCIEVLNCYKKLNMQFKKVCLILPTTPFINVFDLKCANQILDEGKYNCVFTVVENSPPIQRAFEIDKNGYIKMKYPENINVRTQDLTKTYHDAGQFYFIEINSLIKEKRFFTDHSYGLLLSEFEAQDIDNESDWKLAEVKYGL